MLKVLVFDFGGVIVDTETQWYYIYRDWLKKVCHYDLSIQDYLVCVSSSSERLFAFLKRKLDTDGGIRKFEKQAMAEFIERARTLPATEDVTELVTAAKKKGLRLAAATSATRKKPQVYLERLQLLEHFDAFSTAELSRHIKPAPDVFLKAAELLGCSCAGCLAIEDSRSGLIAADKAGMPHLIVPNKVTESSDFTGCYHKASSLKELKLEELIADFQSSQQRRNTMLELIKEESVEVDVHATDWEDAIRRSAQHLLETGKVKERYIRTMTDAVHRVGPYIVLGNHVALAHARPGCDVSELLVHFTTLQPPTPFGSEKLDPVSLIITLAAVDADNHLELISELADILMEETHAERLSSCTTEWEFVELLRRMKEESNAYYI